MTFGENTFSETGARVAGVCAVPVAGASGVLVASAGGMTVAGAADARVGASGVNVAGATGAEGPQAAIVRTSSAEQTAIGSFNELIPFRHNCFFQARHRYTHPVG